MARDIFWEKLTSEFPQTSQKLRGCVMGCWGDGVCAVTKRPLRGEMSTCLMSKEDLEKIELVRQSVAAKVVVGGAL